LILAFDKVIEGDIKDTELIDKLTTQEELSGLLNLALIALKQLHRDKGFKDISVERIRQQYEENANTVKAFLDAKCVVDLTASEYYTLIDVEGMTYLLFTPILNHGKNMTTW
jgi:putative DNA primase/helicase